MPTEQVEVTQLEPCPFCGGKVVPVCVAHPSGYAFGCPKCSAKGPVYAALSASEIPASAIAAWNTRTASQASQRAMPDEATDDKDRESPVGGVHPPCAMPNDVERGHTPGCALSGIEAELASCFCGLDENNIIAAVLANVSAGDEMLKVDVSGAHKAVQAALSAMQHNQTDGWRGGFKAGLEAAAKWLDDGGPFEPGHAGPSTRAMYGNIAADIRAIDPATVEGE